MTYKEKIIKHYKSKGKKGLIVRYIRGLQELLEQYEQGNYMSTCPLCVVKRSGQMCNDCPWHVLVEITCITKWDCQELGDVEKRKAQIKHWIKSYKESLKNIKENQRETKAKLTRQG